MWAYGVIKTALNACKTQFIHESIKMYSMSVNIWTFVKCLCPACGTATFCYSVPMKWLADSAMCFCTEGKMHAKLRSRHFMSPQLRIWSCSKPQIQHFWFPYLWWSLSLVCRLQRKMLHANGVNGLQFSAFQDSLAQHSSAIQQKKTFSTSRAARFLHDL